MTYAAITGWGKCLPPAVLTNEDLATFLDTDDAWITSRTGMKERRIAHVGASEMAAVAAARALAAAGLAIGDVDIIIYGSCTWDSIIPNGASRVQELLGDNRVAAMDLNTACTSGLYALSVATAMIRSGALERALIIGAEKLSTVLDWSDRNTAVLFGDGAAALVLEASGREEGLLADKLGCYAGSRDTLSIRNYGSSSLNRRRAGPTDWTFEGQEIFKRAVFAMAEASEAVLAKAGMTIADVDLVVPHQANLRIIEAVGRRLGIATDKVFVNVARYGNMSAATALVALVEAVEEGYVGPGNAVLMPAFGAGLAWNSHLLRWGDRTQPLGLSGAELAPCDQSALDLIQPYIEHRRQHAGEHLANREGD